MFLEWSAGVAKSFASVPDEYLLHWHWGKTKPFAAKALAVSCHHPLFTLG